MAKKHNKNLIAAFNKVVDECKETICSLIAPGESVDIPFTEEDTEEMDTSDNLSVMVEGRHNNFYLSIKTVSRDKKGNICLTGRDEDNWKDYDKPADWYIFGEGWPYIAEAVKRAKNAA